MVDGADTTDHHGGAGTRGAGVLGYQDTGSHTLEHIVHTGLRLDFEVVFRHRRNGCGDHRFLLDAVADDHGLFQHFGVVLEDDHQVLCSVIDDYLRDIADAGDFHIGATTRGEGEVAVHSRHSTVVGSLLNYERSDNRLVGGITHDTLEGGVLRHGNQTQSQCKD